MTLDYVLITPARNEEAYIEKTLRSVIDQTMLPKRWVIVSDGSTDRTDEIVKHYVHGQDWIEFVQLPKRKERHFAAKVNAFNTGYERVKHLKFEIIGNLDADISFEKDFFEFLIKKFEQIPELGVAGTPFLEEGYSSINDSYEGGEHVSGQCQLFRKACYESIGGYSSIREGHVDKIAVVKARMKGWKTRSFKERTFYHHRKLGTGGNNNKWKAMFDYGRRDYRIGRHPVWESIRIGYRMTKTPYVIGGMLLMSGYIWASMSRERRPVSSEFVKFYQEEQMIKLKQILVSLVRGKRYNKYPEDV